MKRGTKYLTKQVELDMITDGLLMHFYFAYDTDIIDAVKCFQGAKFIPEDKHWSAPICEHNNYVFRLYSGIGHYSRFTQELTDIKPSRKELKAHQIEGMNWLITKRTAMLGFRMGLGKTLTTIEAIEYLVKNKGIYRWWLVTSPGPQAEWKRQLKQWKAHFSFEVVTTYESLHNAMKKAVSPPQGVVFDESVKIKNPTAQRSQIAYELTRIMRATYEEPYVFELSGSAAPKAPTDWWWQIQTLQPGFLREGTIHTLRNNLAEIVFEDGPYGRYPKTTTYRDEDVQRLGARLSPIVLFKDKKDCFDFPDKIYDLIECPCDDATINIARNLAEQAGQGIAALHLLRELSDGFFYEYDETHDGKTVRTPNWIGSPKEQIIKELLDFYYEEGRLVIYAPFHATIDRLCQLATNCGWEPIRIDGRGWSHKNALDLFDVDVDTKYVIIANPACVHGISLQKTPALVYYSNDFNPDARNQSEERRDRPGMDTERATRIVDISYLPVDRHVVGILRENKRLENITIEEIMSWLKR